MKHSARTDGNLPMGILKFVLSLLLAFGAYEAVSLVAANVRAETNRQLVAAQETAKARQQTAPEAPKQTSIVPTTVENLEKAIPSMKATSDLLINWAIVLFGGTIGITILGKAAKIKDANWCLVLIPAIWTLLGASLVNGSRFNGKLTYQIAKGEYVFHELNLNLFLQQTFFEYSLLGLGLFALCYLFFRYSLLEHPAGGGE